jgi:hypothetical protein
VRVHEAGDDRAATGVQHLVGSWKPAIVLAAVAHEHDLLALTAHHGVRKELHRSL